MSVVKEDELREVKPGRADHIFKQLEQAIESGLDRIQAMLEKINAEIFSWTQRLPRMNEAELCFLRFLKKVRLRLEDEIALRQGLVAATLAALK